MQEEMCEHQQVPCLIQEYEERFEQEVKQIHIESEMSEVPELILDYVENELISDKIQQCNVLRNENLKMRESIELEYAKKKINLPLLEHCIRDKVEIKFLWGQMRYFTGQHYEILTEERFCCLCKKLIPLELQEKMCSVKIFKSLYRYVAYDFCEAINETGECFYVSFQNKVVDVRSMTTYKHSSDVEVPFTVNAEYIGTQYQNMDTFERLLEDMTGGDEESIKLIWEMLGYILLYLHPKRAFFWMGIEPASGKSVLGEFIRRLLGEHNCSAIEADAIGARFSKSQFNYKSRNLGMESGGKLNHATVVQLKELTGNSTISIEKKGIEQMDIPNYLVLIFASNEPLNIGDNDVTEAFWERCKFIPCIKSCPLEKRNPDLLDKIWEERNAIVSKAVQVASELIKGKFCFTEPKIAKDIISEWRREYQSPMHSFINECLEIMPANNGNLTFTPTQELFEAYLRFSGEIISINVFSARLNKHVRGRIRKARIRCQGYGSPVNGFYGVKIRSDAEGC